MFGEGVESVSLSEGRADNIFENGILEGGGGGGVILGERPSYKMFGERVLSRVSAPKGDECTGKVDVEERRAA